VSVISRQTYWQLSSFYGVYFALLGCVAPYWGLYLHYEGYSALDIGILLGIWALSKVLAPNIWAWLASHKLSSLSVLRLGAGLSIVFFIPIFFVSGVFLLGVFIFLYSFFWNAILPQFEVITLSMLKDQQHLYSRIRLWGSLGFIISVVGLGLIFEGLSYEYLPIVMLILLVFIFLNACWVRVEYSVVKSVSKGFTAYLFKKPVIAFFIVMALLQMAHGPYYTLFSLHMVSYDYSSTAIGWFWALGVVAENIVFWYMHKIREVLTFRFLILMSLLLGVVRWAVIGWYADVLWLLLLVQCFHAATFAIMHALAMEYITINFPGRSQGQGQALYSGFSFGIGGALGAYLSGLSWNMYGAGVCFTLASVYCLIACIIAYRYIRLQPITD
jgi:PPP family 3-phenylpropionic acid transporter